MAVNRSMKLDCEMLDIYLYVGSLEPRNTQDAEAADYLKELLSSYAWILSSKLTCDGKIVEFTCMHWVFGLSRGTLTVFVGENGFPSYVFYCCERA
jgi:hypothetical protein